MQAALRTAPLFPVAVGLLAGIGIDRRGAWPIGVYLIILIVANGCALVRRIRTHGGPALLLLGAVGTGGLLHFTAARFTPPGSIERFIRPTKQIARLAGTIVSPTEVRSAPEHPFQQWSFGTERTVFLLEARSIEGNEGRIRASGLIRVSVNEAVLDLRPGERVELHGWLQRLRPPQNPGAFDWSAHYRRQGIVARFVCPFRESIRSLGDPPTSNQRSLLDRVRTATRALLTDDLTTGADEEAGLLEAMILGHRTALDRRLNNVFISAGCIHFLAVSGIHVVIVMFFARLLAGLLGGSHVSCSWAMLIAVVAYVVVAEPRPPILRAGVIAVLFCIARLIGRDRACLNWISASVIVLAAFDPPMCFDVGYQLSFLAVLGVSYLSPALAALAARFRPSLADRFVAPASRLAVLVRLLRRHAWTSIVVSMGAWLSTIPVVAIYFQRIHPWAALNSLLVFPLVGLTMGLGFAKLILGLISPSVGLLLAHPLGVVDSTLIRFAEFLGTLPGASVDIAAPSWWLTASFYGFLLALIRQFPRVIFYGKVEAPRPDRAPTRRYPTVLFLVTLCVFVVTIATTVAPRRTPDRLVVTVLSVGAGSATVIQLPDGHSVLYDAGSLAPYDVGRSTIVPFLRHRGVSKIDRIYISHPNLDHFSGVPTLTKAIPTGSVFVNPWFQAGCTPGSPARLLLGLLESAGQEIKTLDPSRRSWEFGGARFEWLWPIDESNTDLSSNDSSTVLRVTYAGRSVLLTGDIEMPAQRALLDQGNLDADVLLLPHHGGVGTATQAFLTAVDAKVLIRSTHQETAETFNGLNEITAGKPLYNTADVGAVEVVLDREGLHVYPLTAVAEEHTSSGDQIGIDTFSHE